MPRRRGALLAATAVLCSVPLLRMVSVVRGASRTQYNDYWPMLDPMLAADGGLRWQGLLEARNQHPVVVPKLVYWANIVLWDGDNRTLGLYVVGIAGLTVVGMGVLARGTDGLGRLRRCVLVVTASFLVFVPNGAWSFVKAMSGTAWLTANLLAVAALVAAQRRRRLAAPAIGIVAMVTYGTGLAVWPALVVTVVLRDGWSALRREWPTLAVGAGASAWYLVWYVHASIPGPARPGPAELVARVARALAALPSDGDVVGLGLATVLGAVGVTLWARRRRVLDSAAPWVGLMVYGLVTLVLVSLSRTGTVEGRYVSLAALTWLGLCGTALVAAPTGWRWVAALPVPLLVAASLGSGTAAPTLERATVGHDLLAVAMHLDLADGSGLHSSRATFPPMTDRLRARGHYPFDGEAPMSCGLMGEVVEVADHPIQHPLAYVAETNPPLAPRARASGVLPDDRDIDCVVALDPQDRVVGAGPTSTRRSGPGRAFDVVAEPAGRRVAVRFSGRHEFVVVPERA